MFLLVPAQWSSCRVSVLRMVDCCKNGTHCLPAWHSVFCIGIWGLNHTLIPGCSTASTHCSHKRSKAKCGGQILNPSGYDSQSDLNFKFFLLLHSPISFQTFGLKQHAAAPHADKWQMRASTVLALHTNPNANSIYHLGVNSS